MISTDIGCCGDDCIKCPRYIATKNDDMKELHRVAELWIQAGWREKVLNVEEIKCNGCKSVECCRYDNIRNCATEKGLINCGECEKFPCEELLKIINHSNEHLERYRSKISDSDYNLLYDAFCKKIEVLKEINDKKYKRK